MQYRERSGMFQQFVFFSGATVQRGPRLARSWGSWISHNDIKKLVGLLWTRERCVAGTSIWQITQHSQQTHISASDGIRTGNPSQRSAGDPRLGQLGHWGRPMDSWLRTFYVLKGVTIYINIFWDVTSYCAESFEASVHSYRNTWRIHDYMKSVTNVRVVPLKRCHFWAPG